MKKTCFCQTLFLTLILATVSVFAQNVAQLPKCLENVPNASGYTLVQGVNLISQMHKDLHKEGTAYDLANNVEELQKQGIVFDRVGYCLEYAPTADAPVQYAFVSFDSANMTTNVAKLGVPDFQSGIFYRQTVKNLDIVSNVEGVSGTAKQGYLEFWPCNYAKEAFGAIAAGDHNSYDINDQPAISALWGYGCMQIHNLDAQQPVICLNCFNVDSGDHRCKAFGIGKASSGEPDYTFNYEKEKYAVGNLYMFVRPCKAVLTTNETVSGIEFYQREKDGTAMVTLSGTYKTANGVTIKTIEAEAENGTKATLNVSPNGTYFGTMTLPGGWHSVTIKAMDESGTVVATTTMDKVGVGEIFITCGQSNSANHGDVENGQHNFTKTGNAVMYEYDLKAWIPSRDPQRGATGNAASTWVPFADALSKELGVPVATVATGFGGSSVAQWQPGAKERFLEQRLLPAVRAMNGKFAGILWHQGETDFSNGMKKNDYYRQLRTVIYMTRKEAGWDVPWGVALVSYAKPHGQWTSGGEALEAQKQVIADDPLVFEGPNTDILPAEMRGKNGNHIHFGVTGQVYVGEQWVKTAKEIIENR